MNTGANGVSARQSLTVLRALYIVEMSCEAGDARGLSSVGR